MVGRECASFKFLSTHLASTSFSQPLSQCSSRPQRTSFRACASFFHSSTTYTALVGHCVLAMWQLPTWPSSADPIPSRASPPSTTSVIGAAPLMHALAAAFAPDVVGYEPMKMSLLALTVTALIEGATSSAHRRGHPTHEPSCLTQGADPTSALLSLVLIYGPPQSGKSLMLRALCQLWTDCGLLPPRVAMASNDERCAIFDRVERSGSGGGAAGGASLIPMEMRGPANACLPRPSTFASCAPLLGPPRTLSLATVLALARVDLSWRFQLSSWVDLFKPQPHEQHDASRRHQAAAGPSSAPPYRTVVMAFSSLESSAASAKLEVESLDQASSSLSVSGGRHSLVTLRRCALAAMWVWRMSPHAQGLRDAAELTHRVVTSVARLSSHRGGSMADLRWRHLSPLPGASDGRSSWTGCATTATDNRGSRPPAPTTSEGWHHHLDDGYGSVVERGTMNRPLPATPTRDDGCSRRLPNAPPSSLDGFFTHCPTPVTPEHVGYDVPSPRMNASPSVVPDWARVPPSPSVVKVTPSPMATPEAIARLVNANGGVAALCRGAALGMTSGVAATPPTGGSWCPPLTATQLASVISFLRRLAVETQLDAEPFDDTSVSLIRGVDAVVAIADAMQRLSMSALHLLAVTTATPAGDLHHHHKDEPAHDAVNEVLSQPLTTIGDDVLGLSMGLYAASFDTRATVLRNQPHAPHDSDSAASTSDSSFGGKRQFPSTASGRRSRGSTPSVSVKRQLTQLSHWLWASQQQGRSAAGTVEFGDVTSAQLHRLAASLPMCRAPEGEAPTQHRGGQLSISEVIGRLQQEGCLIQIGVDRFRVVQTL